MKRALAAVVGATLAATSAQAQTAGTGDIARHAGLGGGGIALPGSRISSKVNPAGLASSTGIRVLLPRIGLSGSGEKDKQALQNIIDNRDFDHLLDLGIGLAKERTTLWTDLEGALRFNHFEIGFSGGGELAGTPNAPLRRAAQGGTLILPPNARYVAEFGYQGSVPLAYGRRFRVGGRAAGDLDVGARVIPIVGRYERTRFRGKQLHSGSLRIFRTLEARDSGFNVGMDLGLRYAPQACPDTTFGLVARGLSEGAIGEMRRARTLDLGAARRINDRLDVTADWLNIPGADHRHSKFGVGAEYVVLRRWLTFRGGVSTRGFAAGVDLGPLSLAYSRDGETLLGTGFSF